MELRSPHERSPHQFAGMKIQAMGFTMVQLNRSYFSPFRKGAIALFLASTAAVSACGYGEPVTEEPVAEPDVAV